MEALSVANLHWTRVNGEGKPPFSYRIISYDGRPVRGMGDVTLAAYPRVRLVPEMLVTKDSRIFCAASFSACLNLGLEIVSEFLGPRAMLTLARVLLIDINRTAQLPYANLQQHVQHGDDLVMRAQALLLSRLRRRSDLESMAKRFQGKSRTLHRRINAETSESPLVFLQNARIERAKRLLETTNISFDQIAYRVGYDDVSSFRRLFTRSSGISPGSYRQKFGLRKSKNAPAMMNTLGA